MSDIAESVTISEFVARLGYSIDEESQRRFVDAIGTMNKAVLGLSAGLLAAAGGVISAVTTMAGSSEHFYYLSQRIGDSVKDVDALAFAFSKLGLSPQEAVANIRAMADSLHNNPYVRSVWRSITGSDEINSESLQKFGDYYHRQSLEMQRYIRTQLLPQFSQDFYLALNRGGPGGGIEQFNLVQRLFNVDPDQIAKQSVAYENALRDVGVRFSAIRAEVQGAMLPALTQSTQELQNWLDRHAPQINKTIADITGYLHSLPEPVRVAVGAIAAITESMGKWDAGTAALAIVLGEKLLGPLTKVVTNLGYLAAIRVPTWLLAVLGVGGATIGGAGAVLGYTYEQNKADQERIARGEKPTAPFPLLGSSPGALPTATPEQNAEVQRQKDAAGAFVGSLFTRFRDWTNNIGAHDTPAGAPGSAAPAAPTGDQGGLWQRLQNVLEWINPISAAHAEELPPNIKILSRNVSDLNETLTDMLDQQAIGAGLQALGSNLGSGGGTGGGGISKGINSPEAAAAVRFFMSKGWTLPQAIGIVSNLLAESGLNPAAENATGHVGAAQWDQKRQQDFRLKYGHPLKGSPLQEQLEFADWELHNSEAAAGQDLSRQFDPRSAALSVNRNYERSDDRGGGRAATADALARNPNLYTSTTTNTGGQSVNQTNTVTINAPSGNGQDIVNAWVSERERNWADVNRNLRTPLY